MMIGYFLFSPWELRTDAVLATRKLIKRGVCKLSGAYIWDSPKFLMLTNHSPVLLSMWEQMTQPESALKALQWLLNDGQESAGAGSTTDHKENTIGSD